MTGFLSAVVQAIRIAVILVSLTAVTVALGLVHLPALAFNWPIWKRIPRYWHKAACRLLGIRVRVHGLPETRRPLMLSSNHVSWKDILVLGSILDVVYVSKAEVRDWPVFGLLARLQRSVFIDRTERRRSGQQASEIAERLRDGQIVVLFPEGTTSDGNRVQPIKSTLFGAAAAAVPFVDKGEVHVQPVAIAYTGLHGVPMGRFHRPVAAWPGDIELIPHLKGVLAARALEVDVCFAPSVTFTAQSNRKANAAIIERRMRRMLGLKLRGLDAVAESADLQTL